MLCATHFVEDGEIFTKGKYKVVEVFKDNEVKFECFDRCGCGNELLILKFFRLRV